VFGLDIADGDRWSVASVLFSGGVQIGERRVGNSIGVEVKGSGILGLEALDQILGGKRPPAARAGLDPRRLVDLVTEGGDLPRPAVVMLPT
jgi:hypothetical protein